MPGKKKETKQPKIKVSTLKVVYLSDLLSHHLMKHGFDDPSYGDYGTETLVQPYVLRNELVRRDKEAIDGIQGHLQPLIDELNSVPNGVWVNIG